MRRIGGDGAMPRSATGPGARIACGGQRHGDKYGTDYTLSHPPRLPDPRAFWRARTGDRSATINPSERRCSARHLPVHGPVDGSIEPSLGQRSGVAGPRWDSEDEEGAVA